VSDDLHSLSDGNYSETDEINKIYRLQQDALAQKEAVDLNQPEVEMLDSRIEKLVLHNFQIQKIGPGANEKDDDPLLSL
jgi:hypothetical protein